MKNRFGIAFGVGLVVIAAAVAIVLYSQRGAHIQVTGTVLKVRTAPLDENSSIAAVDFRIANPADYAFVVRSVTVLLENPQGAQTEGSTVSDSDMQRLFEGIPLLGQKYNQTLMAQGKIAPHAAQDRMVAARFEIPEAQLEKRKRFILRIEEVDGAISEINEK